MPCYHPLPGYMSVSLGESGKTAWRFSRSKKLVDPVRVPCGRCIGCKLERARQWSVRCMHHAQMREDNSFITLTYDEKHLPADGGLRPEHFTNFMKALRPRVGAPIEYFMCGEYGDNFGRPHYHAILFGVRFPDEELLSTTSAGSTLCTSAVLTALWRRGFATIGAVTLESAAYVARYTSKKIYGSKASRHYTKIDPHSGEIFRIKSEYIRMSLKRPIGRNWFDQFKSDVYPRDEVIVRGQRQKPPRYYDKQLSEAEIQPIKTTRKEYAKKSTDNTQARLDARELVKLAQIKQLKRDLQ